MTLLDAIEQAIGNEYFNNEMSLLSADIQFNDILQASTNKIVSLKEYSQRDTAIMTLN